MQVLRISSGGDEPVVEHDLDCEAVDQRGELERRALGLRAGEVTRRLAVAR